MLKGSKKLSGEDAFKLHDTYGFPIDLTQLMAREQGVEVDVEGFTENMQQQKNRARAAGKFGVDHSESKEWTVITKNENEEFEFVGYDDFESEVTITQFRKEGDKYALQFNKTPFYAESGGQVADTGLLTNGEEFIHIIDVRKAQASFIHYTEKLPDNISGLWTASIDLDRRLEIQKHHSATHLAHAALREILGDHVAQKGSLVNEHHLRFDFSHYEAMTKEQLDEVEAQVNAKIQENIPLTEERNVPIEEAREKGAMMLFGEKYGEFVRVITFDEEYSVELCGGTHVGATGEIGYFRFLNESSAAAGIRRIEAVTGKAADKLIRKEKHIINDIKSVVGQTSDAVASIVKLQEEKKALEKELERLNLQNTGVKLEELIKEAEKISDDISLVKGEIVGADMNVLKQLGYDALQKTPSHSVIVLGSKDEDEGKVFLMVGITDDLIKEKGLKAGALVGQLGRLVGGGGGGQPNLATAGGKKPEKLKEALEMVNDIVLESIR